MAIVPQTSYGDEPTLPKRRVWFDYNGSNALTTGGILCFDVSQLTSDGKPIVARPATADLSALAGVYVGDQGASIAEDRWIDIVPADAYGHVVTVQVANDTYAENVAIVAANGSFAGVIADDPDTSGQNDVSGDAARNIPGFLGICLDAGTDPGTVAVLITR